MKEKGMTGKKYNLSEIGKVPPQAVELEEVVIGGILLEKDAFAEVMDIISVESFYKESHQKIYSACKSLYSQNKPIDTITVVEFLKSNSELDAVGGPAYLTQLTLKIASAAHIEFHARLIQQKYIQRELIHVSTEIQNRAYDETIDVSDLIEFSQAELNKISTSTLKKMGLQLWEIGARRLKELETIAKQDNKFTGVKCWEKVNKLTGGWQSGNFILLAARPSMGKTRIAQEMGKIASMNNTPTAFFSLEMADTELYDRELSSQTGIENMYIRQADFSINDWERIDKAQKNIETINMIIDDTPSLTVTEFRAKARLYKKKHNVGLIIIDYLQLMKSPDYKKIREQEISDISGTIKSVAKELQIPIIALSQLSRDVEKRSDKRPVLSDLRESGSLEQDADTVIFIYRPEVYEPDEENKNLIELIFAKHRSGSTGSIKLWKSDKWSTIYESRGDISEIEQYNEDAF